MNQRRSLSPGTRDKNLAEKCETLCNAVVLGFSPRARARARLYYVRACACELRACARMISLMRRSQPTTCTTSSHHLYLERLPV